MKFIDNIPIYLQIKDILIEGIITNKYKPGTQMLSVRQLAIRFSVNSNTVQKALREMIDDKILISKRGMGNFITNDLELINSLKERIINESFNTLYLKLEGLKMSNIEITNSFESYLKERKNKHD